MDVIVDDKLRDCMVALSPDERRQLEESILEHGCLDSIKVWPQKPVECEWCDCESPGFEWDSELRALKDGSDGFDEDWRCKACGNFNREWDAIVLDGHNRYEICTEHDLQYEVTYIYLPDREAAEDWIDKNQLGRRNLTPDQFRYYLGRRYNRTKKAEHDGGKGKPRSGDQNEPNLRTADKLARQHGVSPATVKRAGEFAQKVDKKPELLAALKQRENVLKTDRKLKHEQQRKHERETAKKAKNKIAEKWTVTDKQDAIDCNVLLTDPPYGILDESWEPAKLEDFTRDWLKRWCSCGAEFIASFWSQRFLWEGRQWFDEELADGYHFQHLLVWHYPNNKSPQSRMGFKQTWEPILLYRNFDCHREISIDSDKWGDGLNDFDCHVAAVPQTNFNAADHKQHPAQKPVSVMRWLVATLSTHNQLVCDPFCGSGTTGIAAVAMGRRFHGIESNADYAEAARGRIATYGVN